MLALISLIQVAVRCDMNTIEDCHQFNEGLLQLKRCPVFW